MFILYLLLSAGAMVLIKAGGGLSLDISGNKLCFQASLLSIAGITLYIVSFVLWITILKSRELSLIFPKAAAATAAITVIYGIFAGESITLIRISGIVLIIIGVAIIR